VLDAFRLLEHRAAWLIGGGGKTSLMYALAHALVADGRTVITSTSTRIRPPRPDESPLLVLADEEPEFVPALRAALARFPHVTVALSRLVAEDKLAGLPLAALESLEDEALAAHLLVEADGAARRSLKAYLGHEPVVSARPGLVIAVVGVDVLGRALDDTNVHRAALLQERLGRPAGALVTPEDIAAAVLGPGGYASRVAPEHEFALFLSKADTPAAREAAEQIAAALRAADTARRIARIVIGDVHTELWSACLL
jgi:probable selenium-dependent hydroxylase accessory protein YqeC